MIPITCGHSVMIDPDCRNIQVELFIEIYNKYLPTSDSAL